jgi:hypothetical protein
MTYTNYQSSLNVLKDVICRRTCRVFVMRIVNAANNLS